MSHLIPNIRRHFLSILAKCQNIGHIATFINIFATENMSDSSSAASERFGRCSLAGDEHIGRPAPLTADEGVDQCSLAADREVGRPVLVADEDVHAQAEKDAGCLAAVAAEEEVGLSASSLSFVVPALRSIPLPIARK